MARRTLPAATVSDDLHLALDADGRPVAVPFDRGRSSVFAYSVADDRPPGRGTTTRQVDAADGHGDGLPVVGPQVPGHGLLSIPPDRVRARRLTSADGIWAEIVERVSGPDSAWKLLTMGTDPRTLHVVLDPDPEAWCARATSASRRVRGRHPRRAPSCVAAHSAAAPGRAVVTRRDRPETPQQVEVVELMSAETPPLAVLQSRAGHSWWAFLLPRARPNGAEQWRIARSVLDEALSGADWDEREELSKQPAVASRPGAPRDLCLETATGSDPDGVPWTDLIEVDVSRTGVMRVRRTRRRYPTRPRMWTEVHWDTRAAGLPPTGFRPLELSAPGSQRQVDGLDGLDGLDRFLHGQGIVPENALDEMFSPDRG